MYILLTQNHTITIILSLCKKIKSKIELRRCQFRDLNLYFMTSLTYLFLFLKRRLLKIAKSHVLSTGGNGNSKPKYGNGLKFVMAFLDR